MHRVVLIVSLSCLVGCGQPASTAKVSADSPSSAAKPSASTAASATAPEVKLVLKDFAGIQELIASKKGKIVVVDAWSTYCEPCMREFPGLVAMHKKYGDKIACVSLCANYAGLDKPEEVMAEPLEFLKAQGATFDNVLSTLADQELYQKLDIDSVPSIFVYDREGKLLKKFEGEPTYKTVEEFVVPLL